MHGQRILLQETPCPSEGRKGQNQAGPKGHKLEVGARRAPKLQHNLGSLKKRMRERGKIQYIQFAFFV